ncbi:MAG: type II toxin-antitoxin system VapC family toxin [Candidatus Binataceae bacterium]
MILVDTSVWIDYFNGRTTAETGLLDRLLGVERLLMGDLILAEVLQGFRSAPDFERARRLLAALEFRAMVGREIAISAARNYRTLRARGLTMRKTIDALIATFCIERGHTLLHCDRDFDGFERHLGLRVLRA